ncbi:hypothetical protein [Alteribacillus sp. HJP-4]|uniref:hypothetical protein n=1 Tax=Alteribacillus sp. HJP-4 TaxID=2775394 RepID=UPI0035CD33B8
MNKNKVWKWSLPLMLLAGAVIFIYVAVTPTFSHEYKQLTQRLEVGLKYTEPKDSTMYVLPYVENPNGSDLTFTHNGSNFFGLEILDKQGNVIKGAVTLEANEEASPNILKTTLGPGEKESQNHYYKVTLDDEADRIQISYNGKVKDEFGLDKIEEVIEIDVNHLLI